MILVIFFFFSSRRRHTRFDCDWSSDVCSSDLVGGVAHPVPRRHLERLAEEERPLGGERHEAPEAEPREGGRERQGREAEEPARQIEPGEYRMHLLRLPTPPLTPRSEEHTSELQSQSN